jgi:AAA domain
MDIDVDRWFEREKGEQVRDSRPVDEYERPDVPGLSHAEVLAIDVAPTDQVVEDIIEAGTVGTIAALPELHKSSLASEIAVKVAAGKGLVLGRCKISKQGPVGYWWQDDSKENELRRIQAYAARHDYGAELPIRWHLNEGLRLPDDLPALREEIEREVQVLALLDSLYNFLPKLVLKAEDVAHVLAALKSDVCDRTGCAVGFVDHSPWPTESNEGRRRGYGSVFKAAVIRWGIYLERRGETLYVEARGNNLVGLKRTAAVWNAERLELQLVEPEGPTADITERLVAFLQKNAGATTTVVRAGVTGNDATIDALLREDDRFTAVPPKLFGKPRNATCWALTEDVPSLLDSTSAGDEADVGPTWPQETKDNLGSATSSPVRGEERADLGWHPRPESGPTSDPDAPEGDGEGREET